MQQVRGCAHAAIVQQALEFMIGGKMRLNQGLGFSNHNNHSLDSTSRSFLDCMLDQRLASNGEHFLRYDLRCGKHPGTETRCGNHCLQDFFAIGHRNAILKRTKEKTWEGQNRRAGRAMLIFILLREPERIPISFQRVSVSGAKLRDARSSPETIPCAEL